MQHLSSEDIYRRNLLGRAVVDKQPLSVVQSLVFEKRSVLEMKDENVNGFTPFQCACFHGASFEIVQYSTDQCPEAGMVEVNLAGRMLDATCALIDTVLSAKSVED
jgi:hypothetical protein